MDKFLGDDAVVSVGGFPFYYLFVCFFFGLFVVSPIR